MNCSRLTDPAARARVLVGLLLCGLTASVVPVPASADVSDLNDVSAPIVRVNVQHGDVTIRTWDRRSVEVDGDPGVVVRHRVVRSSGDERSILIPQAQAMTAQGPVTLPAESFVVSSIPAGPRDVVVVRSTSPADVGPVTVHVPSDTVFVYAHATNGSIDVHDYKSGTLIGFVGRGRLSLDDVGGTVFAQANRGPLTVTDSSFDHLRARSLFGNMAFERCAVRQIEATSIAGSIVYDGGSFAPGLARFESTTGNVAIGASGPAQLGARATGGGRVYTDFANGARVDARGDAASANIGGGGPVVTATSASGNVYLYDGSLRSRSTLPPPWRAATQTLDRPAARVPFAPPAPVDRYRTPVPRERVPAPRYSPYRVKAKTSGGSRRHASRYAAAARPRADNRTLRRTFASRRSRELQA